MKEIKTKNGMKIELKDFCSRKLKKELNKITFDGAEYGTDENGKPIIKSFNPDALTKANDCALLGMVSKITNEKGEELPIIIETFDDMDNDVDLIIKEINTITNPETKNSNDPLV